jgi:hypothetical protein
VTTMNAALVARFYGWIEYGSRWSWRITDAGVAALKERS